MSLINLPDEILIKIFTYLDSSSLINLYYVNERVRKILHERSLLAVFSLRRSLHSFSGCLQYPAMKSFAPYIRELILSGVQDLSKSTLVNALPQFHRLQSLDVSFTRIGLLDLVGLYPKCPHLKRLVINLLLLKTVQDRDVDVFNRDKINQCQKVLNSLEFIHFMGDYLNLVNTHLPLALIENCDSLQELNITGFSEIETPCYQFFDYSKVPASLLKIIVSKKTHHSHQCSLFINKLLSKFEQYDAVLLSDGPTPNVFVTERIQDKFTNATLGADPIDFINANVDMSYKLTVWNTSFLKISNNLLNCLSKSVNIFKPRWGGHSCKLNHDLISVIQPAATNSVILSKSINSCALLKIKSQRNKYNDISNMRRKALTPSLQINLDELPITEKNRIKVTLRDCSYVETNETIPINSISFYESNNLKNITFLSIVYSKYILTKDSFKIIFTNCSQLDTLNAFAPNACSYCLAIAQSISDSCKLRALYLSQRDISYRVLLSKLIKVQNLQILHLYNKSDVVLETFPINELKQFISNHIELLSLMLQVKTSGKLNMLLKRTLRCNNLLKPYTYVTYNCNDFNLNNNPYNHERNDFWFESIRM